MSTSVPPCSPPLVFVGGREAVYMVRGRTVCGVLVIRAQGDNEGGEGREPGWAGAVLDWVTEGFPEEATVNEDVKEVI